MKTELILYKVLTFLLLPVAVLLGLNCLSAIAPAFSNPQVLIVIFLFACITIYIVASFIFLTRGIDKNSARKPVLKDLIKINGTITFILCLLALPYLINNQLQASDAKMIMQQIEAQNHLTLGLSVSQFQVLLTDFIRFVIGLSFVLLVHIAITFHLMRRYHFIFEPEKVNAEPE